MTDPFVPPAAFNYTLVDVTKHGRVLFEERALALDRIRAALEGALANYKEVVDSYNKKLNENLEWQNTLITHINALADTKLDLTHDDVKGWASLDPTNPFMVAAGVVPTIMAAKWFYDGRMDLFDRFNADDEGGVLPDEINDTLSNLAVKVPEYEEKTNHNTALKAATSQIESKMQSVANSYKHLVDGIDSDQSKWKKLLEDSKNALDSCIRNMA